MNQYYSLAFELLLSSSILFFPLRCAALRPVNGLMC